MKISIITISFNQSQFLQACIDSVAQQTGPWEHIVVDAGSTDGSRPIIEKQRNHFSDIVFEPDDGPADGLNKGFARATGDVLCYINSDDYFLPGAFEFVRQEFAAHNSADVLYGAGDIVNQDGQVISTSVPSKFLTRHSFLSGGAFLLQQSTFMRRSAFKAGPGFNVGNRTCWDAELVGELLGNNCKFRRSTRRLSCFRIHNQSITGGATPASEAKYRETRRKMFKDTYGRAPNTLDQLLAFNYRAANRGWRFAERLAGEETQ